MDGTNLTGLEGSNPLGFLAALGVQTLFQYEEHQPRLWWTNDVIPHAVIDHDYTLEVILEQATSVLPAWAASPAFNPPFPKGENLKFTSDNLRSYLEETRAPQPGNAIAAALVAEGSHDNNKRAKPSDLYFTAGQQSFLKMAKEILHGVTPCELHNGLTGPWRYTSKLPSLMWDIVDDRIYALSSFNPAGEKKLTNPGPEALAILGLSRHPVFASQRQAASRGSGGRTLTRGCSGSWKQGSYTWPLWSRPSGPKAVDSILAHATGGSKHLEERSPWYRAWGITQVMKSAIRRSNQGGYGTFGPPEVIWP